jgi:hypothetical protein
VRLTTVALYAVEGLQLVDKVKLALNACASYVLEEPFRAVGPRFDFGPSILKRPISGAFVIGGHG